MNKSVLIIEDDKSIQKFLSMALTKEGYEVFTSENGIDGISTFYNYSPDLILLDLGLPDFDGSKVLEALRETSDIPIIIISARDRENEKISALDSGADDYIVKPFGVGEVLARIRAALRRYSPKDAAEKEFTLDYLTVDFNRRLVFVHGKEVHFTPLEYKMLCVMIEYRGKVMTHKNIQDKVWDTPTNDEYQTLRVFIANIRRKIEDDGSNPRYIITEIGVGYRFADT